MALAVDRSHRACSGYQSSFRDLDGCCTLVWLLGLAASIHMTLEAFDRLGSAACRCTAAGSCCLYIEVCRPVTGVRAVCGHTSSYGVLHCCHARVWLQGEPHVRAPWRRPAARAEAGGCLCTMTRAGCLLGSQSPVEGG